MIRFAALPVTCAVLALSACGGDPAQPGNDAERFAARIRLAEASPVVPTPLATAAPQIADPLTGAAPGPFARGTLTDPASATCGAPLMGPFIGKPADQPTRADIAKALGRTDNLRFVALGTTGGVNSDPANPRLSIMLDSQNIIRDARCG